MEDDWLEIEEPFIYRDSELWKDLKPIKQNDGPNPVVKIAYSDVFQEVYDYFRGVVAINELSERALRLTADAIDLNAANYTVWQYRRKILKHLQCDLEEELEFCRIIIESNSKNYQVWHHRREIVEWLGDSSREKRLTAMIFAQDAKNYHAWEHRQWALRTFHLYDGELEFIDELLDADVRNNSAWNHRYFVISRTTGFTPKVLRNELEYAKQAILKLQDNESPWTYMKGLLQDTIGDDQEIEQCWRETTDWCWKQFFDSVVSCTNSSASHCNAISVSDAPKGSVSPHLLIGLFDFTEHKLEVLKECDADKKILLQTAVEICNRLADTHDVIRCRYWKHEASRVLSLYGDDAETADSSEVTTDTGPSQ